MDDFMQELDNLQGIICRLAKGIDATAIRHIYPAEDEVHDGAGYRRG